MRKIQTTTADCSPKKFGNVLTIKAFPRAATGHQSCQWPLELLGQYPTDSAAWDIAQGRGGAAQHQSRSPSCSGIPSLWYLLAGGWLQFAKRECLRGARGAHTRSARWMTGGAPVLGTQATAAAWTSAAGEPIRPSRGGVAARRGSGDGSTGRGRLRF